MRKAEYGMGNEELTDLADAHLPFSPAKVPTWRQQQSSAHLLAFSIPHSALPMPHF